MANKNDSWGIEIGAQAIKAVNLSRSGDTIDLVDYEILPFPVILTAPGVDGVAQIQQKLDELLSKHEIGKSQTIVSVPGHMAFARFANLPPVAPKDLPKIVQYEAQQQIPFPMHEVEWDYQVFAEDDNPDVRVGIFAITKERCVNYLQHFRRLDMRVDQLTLSPLAVYNAFQYDDPGDEEEGTIYLDIGSQSTDVILVEGGATWLRTLPIGGNQFTEALMKQFQINFPKAEALKREAATHKYARQIMQSMRGVFADLVQELQRSMGYYQSLNRDANITKLVGLGSTFRLPGLRSFLAKQLDIEVVRLDGYKKIAMSGPREAEFANYAMNLATAYGLALQGLGEDSVSANILPQAILNEREMKAKEPWFIGAAAAMVAAAGTVGFTYVTAKGQADADETANKPKVESVVSQAAGPQSELIEVQSNDDRPLIENYHRVQDYSLLQPAIYQDMVRALASASNTQTPDKRLYLEWMDMRYKPVAAPDEADAASSRGGVGASLAPADMYGTPQTLETFFPPDGAAADGAGAVDPQTGEPAPAATSTAQSQQGPRIEVTVSVLAPMNTGEAETAAQRVLTWLLNNANRNDRPYRIIASRRNGRLAAIELQGLTETPQTTPGSTPPTRPGSVLPGRLPLPTPTPGRLMDEGSDFSGGGTVTRGSTGALAAYLPSRPATANPLYLNNGERVVRLVIRWEVELLPPSQAREASNAASGRSTTPPTVAQPAPQARAAQPGVTDGEPLTQKPLTQEPLTQSVSASARRSSGSSELSSDSQEDAS